MYLLSSVIVLCSIAVSTVSAQFVTPPTDLITAKGFANISVRYKEVPTGICELNPKVKSFSGYADVSENEHIFFWFFESRTIPPTEAPLTVWINGGPGSSSMIGLFQENGPCGVDINGNVVNNPFSWSEVSNMIFIDQPTQVGFSYSIPVPGFLDPDSGNVVVLPSANCPDSEQASGTCGTYSLPNATLTANSTAAAAPNFWATLQGFMGAFPQYSRNEFNFATESYGGHYGPVFNEYIEMQNAKNIPGAHKINLKTVMIGNGWYDPLIQYQAYYNYTVSPGNPYDFSPFNASVQALMFNNLYGAGNCVDQLKNCAAVGTNRICSTADDFCANNVEGLYDEILHRDEDDIRELNPDRFPYEFYVDYLNTPSVQAAMGAFQNYSEFSPTVGNAFGTTGDDGREDSTVEDMGELLSQGITVMMYTGDADYNCNFLGGEVVSNLIGAPGFDQAGYVNISTSDSVVHGQVKQSGAFSFVRIYFSGHEVPFYQPLTALSIFERAINGKDIATGKKKVISSYRTIGTPQSLFREGISTVQFSVLPPDAIYNTTLGAPNPETSMKKRTLSGRSGKAFKPRRV